jgi:hypothetical protein
MDLVPELNGIAKAFAKDKAVVHYKSTSLCVGKKVFVMVVKGDLVVKLSAARAQELVAEGRGRFHEAGGRAMKEWFTSPVAHKADWVKLAKESKAFVAGA